MSVQVGLLVIFSKPDDLFTQFVSANNAAIVDAEVPVHSLIKHGFTGPACRAAASLARMHFVMEVLTTMLAIRCKI